MTAPTIFFSLNYRAGNQLYTLNSYDTNTGLTFSLFEFSDVGLPPISRITQKGAFQNGDTNIDFRLGPRKFTIRGMVPASNTFENLNVRQTLSQIFKVTNTRARLLLTSIQTLNEDPFTETIMQREIECFVEGGLNFSSDTSGGYDVFYDVALYAPSPLWYDPTAVTVTIGTSPTGDATDVPLTVPRTYGSTELNDTTVIPYTGTFLSYPIITIESGSAGMTGVRIRNNTQGTEIVIPTIQANMTLRLDLRYGYKTVLDGDLINQIALIDPSSDLTTFALVPSINTQVATNFINVTADSSGTDASVSLRYNTQYTAV
jgi:hypothetical protein